MNKVIIVGSTSGIGLELAKNFYQNNYLVGIVGRRSELFLEIQKIIPTNVHFKRIDVSKTAEAMELLKELINEMGGVDIVVISSGIGFINPDLEWEKEKDTIDVNTSGFTAMANVAYNYFCTRGEGQIVGISSIAAIRGSGSSPAYNASKAFVSNYLQGLRHKISRMKIPIIITDIQPGLVDTAMAQGEGLFWVSSPENASQQIFNVIKSKKKHAYITKRWGIIAWILKIIPDFIYNRLGT